MNAVFRATCSANLPCPTNFVGNIALLLATNSYVHVIHGTFVPLKQYTNDHADTPLLVHVYMCVHTPLRMRVRWVHVVHGTFVPLNQCTYDLDDVYSFTCTMTCVRVCAYSPQNASQVGALDVGYTPGFKPAQLKGAKLLYLLGAVSPIRTPG